MKAVHAGIVVVDKRRPTMNPKYPAVYRDALSKVHKRAVTVKTQSVPSPSKLGNAVRAPARLPLSPSPEPHRHAAPNIVAPKHKIVDRDIDDARVAKKMSIIAPKLKIVDRDMHDARVAKTMKDAAERLALATKNDSDPFALEVLEDARPFLSEMVISGSLARALQSVTPGPAAPATCDLSGGRTAAAAPFVTTAVAPSALAIRDLSAIAAPLAASAARSAPSAASKKTVARPVSKSGKTHKELSAEVSKLNKNLPSHLQLKNVKQAHIQDIDNFLQRQFDLSAAASIHAQIDGAKARLTQQIQVTVCMRILTLLVNSPQLLSLYQESCAGADRQQNDAGANPTVNTGLGMGLNHAYFPAMESAFNDLKFVEEFPFEYIPPTDEELLPIDSTGTKRVQVPSKIINGLFAGMGIKECLVPEGFPHSFFNAERLSTIFTAGLSEYHNALAKFSVSGQHGKPLWFFVSPRKTIIAEDQHLYLDLAAKRWDTLAFHLMFEQVHELARIFAKAIPNGKGGVVNAETAAIPPVGSSARVVASRERENAEKRAGAAEARSQECLIMKKERHALHMASGSLISKDSHLETLGSIKSFCDMKKTFDALGDQNDMVQFCDAKIAALKDCPQFLLLV